MRLRSETITLVIAINSLQSSLVAVANSIDEAAAGAADQTAAMVNVVAKLEELATMLETRLTAETTAANTRIGDVVTILGG